MRRLTVRQHLLRARAERDRRRCLSAKRACKPKINAIGLVPGRYVAALWVMSHEGVHSRIDQVVVEIRQKPVYGTRELDVRWGCMLLGHRVRFLDDSLQEHHRGVSHFVEPGDSDAWSPLAFEKEVWHRNRISQQLRIALLAAKIDVTQHRFLDVGCGLCWLQHRAVPLEFGISPQQITGLDFAARSDHGSSPGASGH